MGKYEGHTPGPWKAERFYIVGPDGEEIKLSIYPDDTEPCANAKLIADAPMLAEQNERMLKQLKLHCELCMFMNNGKCPDTIDCNTQTIIAEIESK
jgi:hypothetical protein